MWVSRVETLEVVMRKTKCRSHLKDWQIIKRFRAGVRGELGAEGGKWGDLSFLQPSVFILNDPRDSGNSAACLPGASRSHYLYL